MVVAEFIQVGLGHDQALPGLAQHAFLLQAVGTPPFRLVLSVSYTPTTVTR